MSLKGKFKSKTQTAVHNSIIVVKKTANKNPKLKKMLKNAILPHLYRPLDNSNTYNHWLKNNFPDAIDMVRMKNIISTLAYQPLISIIIPTYNTDSQFLRDCIDSVLAQAYDNWEICIVDDASPQITVREVIKEYAKKDQRIKYKFLKKNHHIAGATNEAIGLASGEFVGLFDHDDILWPNALFEVAYALNQDKNIDFIYTDEDKITEDRHDHLGPFFKPDWNPDFLHSVNYITHFSVIRKTLLNKLGGLKSEYNGAQDWDLFLRVASETNQIHHIQKVLYSWRIHDLSTAKSTDSKPYVIEAQKNAISDDLSRKGYKNVKVEQDKQHSGYWNVTYKLTDQPLISIVIPSKNQFKIVKRCIESIYKKTSYNNFEIVLVDTGSTDKSVLKWYKTQSSLHDNFKMISWPEQPFSYSRSCNEGVKHTKGEFIVMLNNDTEVITHDWLESLAGDAQRREVGAVGALLFFPDRTHIQHAGIGIGLGGVAANSFSMMTLSQPLTQTQHLMLNTKHNMTAVTAACLMVRKSVFNEVGGFDEEFRVTYNDVDLCLKIVEAGYVNIYTPHVKLLHHESISVGLPSEIKKRDTPEIKKATNLFKSKWLKYILHDPNLNSNLNSHNAFYDL